MAIREVMESIEGRQHPYEEINANGPMTVKEDLITNNYAMIGKGFQIGLGQIFKVRCIANGKTYVMKKLGKDAAEEQ